MLQDEIKAGTIKAIIALAVDFYEMHYQDEFPFLFDSSKFQREFRMEPTSYEEAIKITAQWYPTH